MTQEEARALVEQDGYNVSGLVEQDGETFVFNCEDDKGDEIEVCVVDGQVYPSPI